jgi:hypothetical protein
MLLVIGQRALAQSKVEQHTAAAKRQDTNANNTAMSRRAWM